MIEVAEVRYKADITHERENMPRKLPFDAAVGSLRQLVDGMIPGEELVLTVEGEPKAIVTRPARTSWSEG